MKQSNKLSTILKLIFIYSLLPNCFQYQEFHMLLDELAVVHTTLHIRQHKGK